MSLCVNTRSFYINDALSRSFSLKHRTITILAVSIGGRSLNFGQGVFPSSCWPGDDRASLGKVIYNEQTPLKY